MAGPLLIGGKLGVSYNELTQPNDPAGEPTVLFGTSFNGFGFQGGATAQKGVLDLGVGELFLSGDLLVSHQRGSGFAESRTSAAKRTVSISTTGLHIPVLVGMSFTGESGATAFNIGVGPQLLLGLSAGSATKQEATSEPATPLPIRPVTHVGLTAHLGLLIKTSAAWLPIDARFTWDPMVAKSTRDRFDNYVDFDNTGDYAVAFTWQASVMVGFMMDFFSSNEEETPKGTPEPAEPEEVEPEEEPEPELDEDIDLG